MRYWLVMPAAGAGRRFGARLPKQYAPLEGRTVIEWALMPFLADARCAGAVVVLAAADPHWPAVAARLEPHDRGGTRAAAPLRVASVDGGEQRSHSVRNGLAALATRADREDWVLVHDAVRPCLEAADLDRLLAALASHSTGGLLAARATDTLKRAADSGPDEPLPGVAETLERSGLWRALTPQMFRYGRLCAALDAAHAGGRLPTDEAQALEWQGAHPRLIEGAATNLKVTCAADLVLAAAVLRARRDAAVQSSGNRGTS
jgi:2-C-methyl-D-erythritol 4-phosphate cytidylyltransferase